jgi:succinate dehydrogenase / fumarate reductase flavoprotein subunit
MERVRTIAMTTTTTTSAPPTTTTFPIFTEATLDGKAPQGPIEQIWDQTRFNMKLVNPSNRRKFNIIIVGSGLAGRRCCGLPGRKGYNVECYAYQDSPRRAHSVAAQGGINAAKNYRNDGDSIYRLFYDTVKGGDFRAREANVYRLAQVSNAIIDQCVAQGVPFAREYGGMLDNRSFGGAQVSRTFYARGQTGQQLLLGRLPGAGAADTAGDGHDLQPQRDDGPDRRQWPGAGHRHTRDMRTGEIERHAWPTWWCWPPAATATSSISPPTPKAATPRLIWRAYKRGAYFANPASRRFIPPAFRRWASTSPS